MNISAEWSVTLAYICSFFMVQRGGQVISPSREVQTGGHSPSNSGMQQSVRVIYNVF